MPQQAPASHPRAVVTAAVALLVLMAALMLSSSWDDSFTFDEEPHLAAGYTGLRRADYRYNPEHPPLMKDLGALPLLFLNLRPPWEEVRWTDGQLDQWEAGAALIYRGGGDAETILRLARTPMILFTAALGGLIFWWTRRNLGDAAALLTLFFFCLSPTVLAHGRLVTTDVGAAAGFFVATIALLNYLRRPSRKTMLLAGTAMGFALLTKFSTVLLLPAVLLLACLWGMLCEEPRPSVDGLLHSLGSAAAVIAIGFLAIYPFYLHHSWNYPPERQRADTAAIIRTTGMRGEAKELVLWASDKPLLRPYAQYFLGLLMTVKRSSIGNAPFFLGEVFPQGQRFYFPFVYGVKEPLGFHLLTLLALALGLSRWIRPSYTRQWFAAHFTELAFVLVVAMYWVASLRSHLNIGVRHLLPIFPFLYVLVSCELTRYDWRLAAPAGETPPFPAGGGKRLWARRAVARWSLRFFVAAMLAWQAASVLRVHPSYLAYFNELAGGPERGWHYVVDSNIDWGQDLKRLTQFVEQRQIPEIYLDYFGAADTSYYLRGRVRGISSCSEPVRGWVAVSVMSYQQSREKPQCDYRRWLPLEKRVATIGYSIFVFRLD